MPLRLPSLPRLTRRRAITWSAVAVVLVAALTWAVWPAAPSYRTIDQVLTVRSGPSGTEPVELDTTLYLPRSAGPDNPVPAILLAHGFGGTKRSVAEDAKEFAGRGYAVLAWTARGFGRSGGQIHLDSPEHEVRDAQRLLDWLAARPDIRTDGPGDPRAAAVGGSYGGALALLLAAYDQRLDAIVPMITWNDLAASFLAENSGRGAEAGVFKKLWAGIFFGSGGGRGLLESFLPGDDEAGAAEPAEGTGATPPPGLGLPPGVSLPPGVTITPEALRRLAELDPACGRFSAEVCAAYQDVAATGQASPATLELLRRSSPAGVLDRVRAPTLLVQGQADSLFPLSEGLANYRGIAATGTPVRMDWFAGGHDGGEGPRSDVNRVKFLTITWLDHYLLDRGETPSVGFTFSRISGFDAETRRLSTSGFSSDAYPGAGGPSRTVALLGPPQTIANPPGGTPAALTTLPGTGTGGLASLLAGAGLEIPGQHADFFSTALAETTDVVGAPTVRIRAASPTGEAVLFAKLYDTDPAAGSSLPFGLTAPIRLTGLPATLDEAEPVTITLPTIVYRFEAGHYLRLTLSTSDQAYATPAQPTLYTVALPEGGAELVLPQLSGEPIVNPEIIWRYVLAGLVAVLALAILTAVVVARVRRRRNAVSVVPELADTPLVVKGLRKQYADGFVAVSSVDFTVERGQVVGLLGPNGAGKTTSLRVLLGMTRPTAGTIHVFGHELRPGSDVLRRVGALVEGPGFLPHLSGLENLQLYWRGTGRPAEEAHFTEALEIAGLGDAVRRKVRKYSHGMKQRLAIAQAMLGLPELLILDEPTDGLDPPQIAEMRVVLRRYADPAAGRAVLLSSHLLAEVEQTCTHVVVMHKGEVVADGPVDDIVGDSPVARFEVSDPTAAADVLDGLAGVRSVEPDGPAGLVVDLDGTPRPQVVAALVRAGVGVDRVVPRRRLEDAFLTLVGGDTKASGER
jgi:ABC-2 type transport system ATP-binding protein